MNHDELRVYFIIPANIASENDCELEMQATYKKCKEYVNDTLWIQEKDVESISKTKQDVFVLQNFEGPTFDLLINEKCLVVGYRCLKTCLVSNIPIPNIPSPVFIVAMANMVICATGIDQNEKKAMQIKVGYMGGIFSTQFTSQTTHLITNCVNSVKYGVAAQSKMPIYLSSWLEDVWEKNFTKTIRADSPEFDHHLCKPFHNLKVTTTGLKTAEREAVIKLITENGGEYSGKLQSLLTSLLICKPSGTNSEKYLTAKRYKIECCSLDWIYDSIESGYALPFDKYRIINSDVASSTMIHKNEKVDMNFSMASTIQGDIRDISQTIINASNISSIGFKSTPVQSNSSNKLLEIMQKFPELREIKKSGMFLDGCYVYLSGLEDEHREKLCKILNLGGAIRYDEVSEKVTHIIGLDWATCDIEKFHQKDYHPIAMSIEWILESIKLKCPAPEDNFKLHPKASPKDKPERLPIPPSSPLSAKGVQMLRRNSSLNIPKFNLDITPKTSKIPSEAPITESDEFMREYAGKAGVESGDTIEQFMADVNFSKDNAEKPKSNVEELPKEVTTFPIDESNNEYDTTSIDETHLFRGLKFTLFGWDDEEQVTEMIHQAGGMIHPKKWTIPPDYVVVPEQGTTETYDDSVVTVTNFWLEDCIDEKKILDVDYYHKPVRLSDPQASPLKGCVIALSAYKSQERSFVSWLIGYLGAEYADIMSKLGNKKNLTPTTHLICPTPLGSKYNAGVAWGIHVVTHYWLLACAKECKRVPEELYGLNQINTPVKVPSPVTKKVDTPNKIAEPLHPMDNFFASRGIKKVETPKAKPCETEHQYTPISSPLSKAGSTPLRDGNTPLSKPSILQTPKLLRGNMGSPIELSQPMTPIAKFFENIGLPKLGTPDNSPLPATPSHVSTPETPLGRCFGVENPSPETKKYWQKRINNMPSYHFSPEPATKRPRLNSTPLSELKDRLWRKVLPKDYEKYMNDDETSGPSEAPSCSTPTSTKNDVQISSTPTTTESKDTPIKNAMAKFQADQLREMLAKSADRPVTRLSMKRIENPYLDKKEDQIPQPFVIESQHGPVSWNDPLDAEDDDTNDESRLEKADRTNNQHRSQKSNESTFLDANETQSKLSCGPRRFMCSQMPNPARLVIADQINSLGGVFSSTQLFDPEATHLICPTIARNEKMLASIAAGIWLLHSSYIEDSVKAGYFLDEDLYEYGNPKATRIPTIDNNSVVTAVYRWRTRINETKCKAYHNMRAILFCNTKKDQIERLIAAGGGKVLNVVTFDDTDATHCFVEPKSLNEYPQCRLLAAKGVLCLPPVYLNTWLLADPPLNPKDFIIPTILPYYKG